MYAPVSIQHINIVIWHLRYIQVLDTAKSDLYILPNLVFATVNHKLWQVRTGTFNLFQPTYTLAIRRYRNTAV